MAKIHKFVLANYLLDSPMATWLTLTGTLLVLAMPLLLPVPTCHNLAHVC